MPNSNGANNWEDIAMNAKECGSPLALAADILMKLGNVEGLVDVCLICASSFGGAKVQPNKSKEMVRECSRYAWLGEGVVSSSSLGQRWS